MLRIVLTYLPPSLLLKQARYFFTFFIPLLYRFTPMEWVLLDPCDQAEDPEEIEQVNLGRFSTKQFRGF